MCETIVRTAAFWIEKDIVAIFDTSQHLYSCSQFAAAHRRCDRVAYVTDGIAIFAAEYMFAAYEVHVLWESLPDELSIKCRKMVGHNDIWLVYGWSYRCRKVVPAQCKPVIRAKKWICKLVQ